MAVDFDGSTAYMSVAAMPVSGYPFSMACAFWVDNVTASHNLVNLTDGTHGFSLQARGDVGGDPLMFAVSSAGGGVDFATSSTSITASAWHHACAVGASATSRSVYLNGGGKATDTASNTPPSLTTTVLAVDVALAAAFLNGRLAEVGLWSAALDDAEVLSLSRGVSPLLVRPASLVAYWPLNRQGLRYDLIGGNTLSQSGSPATIAHPRIFTPKSAQIIPFVAPAVARAPRMSLLGVGP